MLHPIRLNGKGQKNKNKNAPSNQMQKSDEVFFFCCLLHIPFLVHDTKEEKIIEESNKYWVNDKNNLIFNSCKAAASGG
jgi:hypothetical protein